jgi:hypothetical protein
MTLSPFVAVYKSDWLGNYMLLKTQPNFFEIYSPSIYGCTVGQWNISNDTLFLFPKYEYFDRNSELKFIEITPENLSVSSIPQQYLIKSDYLTDITDYRIILPELFNNQNKVVYKRVTK